MEKRSRIAPISTPLVEKQVLPAQHLVDTSYIDAENIARIQQIHQVDLVGPALPDTSWSSKKQKASIIAKLALVRKQRALPTLLDKIQYQSHVPVRHGKPNIHIRFHLTIHRSYLLLAQFTLFSAKVLILRPG